MISDNEMCYIGRKPCGCIATTFIDTPGHRHYIAKALHDWVLSGLIVERVTVEFVRENWPNDCPHKTRQLSPEEEEVIF